ncbi:helix-turn-helix domain-containing protein [Patescibacteria group bacterium]|nr:helix-turn-helix domain-containing protein [Patescibacteria group bacterium]
MIKLEDKLYTSTEVAEILGVSLRSVYRYIEENKLHAEVKTATGRHRFTKQDIMDFLYPEGVPEGESRDVRPVAKVIEGTGIAEEKVAQGVKVTVESAERVKTTAQTTEVPKEDESVDWLSKFREAAKKFQEDETEERVEGITGLGAREEEVVEEEPVEEEIQEEVSKFYRSGLGGLKDIAQGVDKTARNAQLPYAFTLNAGLSLHSPIKPFSVLHVYIRPSDLEFYEKSLKLTVSDETDAQLGLLLTKDDSVFASSEELHGLFVVTKARLNEDITSLGDQSLRDEADSVLK